MKQASVADKYADSLLGELARRRTHFEAERRDWANERVGLQNQLGAIDRKLTAPNP